MKYIFILLTVVSLYQNAGAQDAMSVWTDKPMTIDAKPYEWPQFFRFYTPGSKFQFDILNDSANLYICVRATEMETQARLMHAGLTIWTDASGKKKQKSGFSFPVKLDHTPDEGPSGERSTGRNQDPSSMPSLRSRVNKLRERVILSQINIKPIDLPGITEALIPLTNKYGLNVAYGWDSLDILYVEYQIPLSLIYQHPVTKADLQKPIALGLVSGSIEVKDEHRSGGGGNDMGAGGMGGSRGGSNRGMGGRPGGMTGQGQTMSGTAYDPSRAEQKTWLKLHLESK